MSNAQLTLWVIALAVGFTSAWRNPTALALLLAFAVSEAGLPPAFYAWPDILTLALIFSKPRYRPCEDYWDLSTWEQLKCILTERGPTDRFVMLSIPMAWYFYAPVLSYSQYWSLYYIAVAQFLVVGFEGLTFILRRPAETTSRPPFEGPLLVAYPGGGWHG